VTVEAPRRRRDLRLNRSGEGERRWPLARIFTVGATVAALVAIAAVVAGGLALMRLSAARTELLDRTGPAVTAAQQLSAALVDQETGVRGFGLTGRPEFLDPYRTGSDAERAAVATLRRLDGVSGFAAVVADLDAVERAAADWRSGYADAVIARTGNATDMGRALFDRVRASVATLRADLDVLRLAARADLNTAASSLTAVGAAIAVVLAAFLVAAAVGLCRAVLRPVSELAGQVREVVSGDVQRPVRATGPREITTLGEDVEAMRLHILADLDGAHEANRRLDEQTRELERSNRDLEQFAYVASHDLQEPLRKVSSFCQLLQRRYGGQLDERADQYIEFAVDGASRMQLLINDLLAFSRVGRTTEEFVEVDLADVAKAAATQLEAARADVAGEILFGELPTVSGDVTLLRQMLVNLVGNGLKFHREGVPPLVTVSAQRVEDGWEIRVADNGIGIEPEYADKVFVLFQRLHARDVYPGTGIGLALAKKIVEFHRGRIRIDPPDGPGTVVLVTLPAAPEEKS
jgi:signal transduction histidine kinase